MLVACVRSGTTICADGTICRDGTVCASSGDITFCVTPEQRAACDDLSEGADCGGDRCYPIDDGLVCLPITCGNHFVDPLEAEQCDDGNTVSEDGCSADCRSTEQCGNGVIDPLRGERCDDANLVSHDGCSSRCDVETPTWRQLLFGPSTSTGAAMAFDVRRGRLVTFGGSYPGPQSSTIFPSETFEWEPGGWSQIETTRAPPGRVGASLAFDEHRGTTILFGGTREKSDFADTWEWSGSEWSDIDAVGPPARADAAMAYDPIGRRMVLFGGQSDDIDLADTWVLQNETWTRLMGAGPPSSATPPTMTFDPRSGVIAIISAGEQWELHGAAWIRIGTIPVLAGARAWLVFDTSLGQRVLVGSQDGSVYTQWGWDGQSWTPLAREPISQFRNLVADQLRGGVLARTVLGVVRWKADGTAETLDELSAGLAPRDGAAAVNVVRHREVIVFGGNEGTRQSPVRRNTTYVFDGRRWRLLAPLTRPSPRWEHGMAYDVAHDRIVLFGGDTTAGLSDETWLWDGTTWENAPASGPSARVGHAMTYDASRGVVVLFGGIDSNGLLGDTWEWDGATWTKVALALPEPPGRVGAALAYDANAGRVVMFGGGDDLSVSSGTDDMWQLGANGWEALSPVVRPTGRMRATLTWSPARRRLQLVGGESVNDNGIFVSPALTSDSWEWDGSRWRLLPASPRGIRQHVAFFAPDGGGTVTVGGNALEPGTVGGVVEFRWSDRGSYDSCVSRADADGDGRAACADLDCWSRCTPLCMPGATSCPMSPACGDGTCSSLETVWTCPMDCGAAPVACGDLVCDPSETCSSECP